MTLANRAEMMKLEIEPIKPLVGAIVRADKRYLCEPQVVAAVLEALEERGVLVFPQISVTDEEQLAFSDCLGGRINFSHYAGPVPGADESARDVYKLTLDKNVNTEPDYVLGTFFWHMDGVTLDIPPPKATMLSARALSAEGGATEFANLYAAYEKLPEDERREIDGLRVIHTIEASVRPVFGHPPQERIDRWRRMAAPMEHPLVWTHANGRKSLLLGSHADGLVGWPGPHGRATLWRLQQWAAQPDFTYRHKWQVGDLLIWNNPAMMHRVVPYTDTRRVMHRTVIAGTEKPGRIASAEAMARMLEPIG